MKINSKKEYEENHETFKDIKDEELCDYFLAISDLYERVSAELGYRISMRWKNNEKRD